SGVKWYDASVLLNNTAEVGELIAAIERDFGEPSPVLIIIDTLSRCSAGADENSNTEMAKVIGAADILQRRFSSSVLIVHHSGKNRDNGPRGASVLSGNVETIIEVDRTSEGCKVACYKQKDAPAFDPLHLTLRPTQYGPEED